MAASGSFNTGNYEGRYLTFSWQEKSQSIANNATTIEWTLKGAGTGQSGYYYTQNIKVTIDGMTVFTHTLEDDGQIELRNGTVVASGTYTFIHNTDGTRTFAAFAEAGIFSWSVNCTGSGEFSLDTIPRASRLTVDNGTLDVEQTLSIAPASNSFKHRLIYECGGVSGYIAGSADSYTSATIIKWTPPIELACENTTGTLVSIALTLHTYTNEGAHIGTVSETISCVIPISVMPSCSIAWQDLSGAAGIYGSPVQGVSSLKILLTEQTSYSSPIVTRTITANAVKYNAAEAATGILTTAGSGMISATVTDQRGRSGSASITLDVLAYTRPVISHLTVHRCDQDGAENAQGDYVEVIFSAFITSLNDHNAATYKLRYKSGTASIFTEVDLDELAGAYVITNHTYIFKADSNSSYDVEVVATDNHSTTSRSTSASTAFTLINWHASGTGMAVGKVSERERAVEFALDLYDKNNDRVLGLGDLARLFYPVGSITLRYDHVDPSTIYGGTWVRISSCVLRGASVGGNIGETGTLADGSGLTYINISIWRRET